MSTAPKPSLIITAPADLAGWLRALQPRELPVLDDTAAMLESLRATEDSVDAHLLAEDLSHDPLMTLKLLRHVAALPRQPGRERADAETVTQALVMLGITPFFRDFGPQPTVAQHLAGMPSALQGLDAVLQRSRRAARFALGFAIHRQDYDAAVLHEAALLHDFAEMLLWVHAPGLALAVADDLRQHPGRRSVEAQRHHLNLTLADLQQALMRSWRLPELLVRISDDHASTAAQVRNVQLAVRVARHSAHGWDDPALPDDVAELAVLLNLGHTPTLALLQEIDAD